MGYSSYTRRIDGVERELGYAQRAACDQPGCNAIIDRGLAYLCGDEPGETEHGCGRYFCNEHLGSRTYGRGQAEITVGNCIRCQRGRQPYPMKPDISQEDDR